MKYSLAQLLLEDTQFQQIGYGKVMPSEELADKVWLFNTYAWIGKVVDLLKEQFGEKAMEKLYIYGTPQVRAKINAARAYAKRKDREISFLITDTTYADYIWSVFDPNGSANNSDREALAKCLGFYSDRITQKPKIEKDASQTDAEFEEEIRQGCKELMLAAAIAAIEDLRTQIAKQSRDLADICNSSKMKEVLDQITGEIGEKGYRFQIDLADDPDIKPIFEAQMEAQIMFNDELDLGTKEFIFSNSAPVAFNISRKRGVVDMCARPRSLPESVEDVTALLMEIDDPDASLDGGSSDEDDPTVVMSPDDPAAAEPESARDETREGPPIQPDPRNLEDALAQIKARYADAGMIQRQLQRTFAIETVVSIAKQTPLGQLMFQFPTAEGRLGNAAQITTQKSIGLDRVVSGIMLSFFTGARTKDVQPATIRMIAPLFDPSFRVTDEGRVSGNADIAEIMTRVSDERDGILNNEEMKRGFMYALCAAAEYASQYASLGAKNMGPVDLATRGRAALEDILGFHALGTRFPDSKFASNIKVAQGVKPKGWMASMVDAAKHPGSLADKRRKFGEKQLTTFKIYPNVSFGEEDTLISPQTMSPRQKKRERDIALVNKTIAQLIKGTTRLAADAVRTRSELGTADKSPGTGGSVGRLAVMTMCDEIARVANRSRASGVGKILMMMGYSSPGSLIIGGGPVTGHDVWLKLCDRSGAVKGPDAPFSAETHFTSWSTYMTGKNGAKSLFGVRWLIASEFISLPLRVAYHAIEGFRDQKILSKGESGTFSKHAEGISVAYVTLVSKVEGIRASAPLSTTEMRLSKTGIGRRILARLPSTQIKLGKIPGYYDALDISKPLDQPTPLDPQIVVAEGAPFVVDPT